jgi:hypothetical protein
MDWNVNILVLIISLNTQGSHDKSDRTSLRVRDVAQMVFKPQYHQKLCKKKENLWIALVCEVKQLIFLSWFENIVLWHI